MVELSFLPEGCVANIISFTSPRDACRLSSVSKIFKSAAESDDVWERFLPPEYPTIISKLTVSPSLAGLSSKKDLYLSLCDNPLLIDDGKKSFSLDKPSGKKCYMISARGLMIAWGDTHWTWSSIPENRFPEVAVLIIVWSLDIRGKICTRRLSPQTLYSTYFVYALTEEVYGFVDKPLQASVALVGTESQNRVVYLDPERGRRHDGYYPKMREDEWLEIELGDFFNEGDEESELEMSILEVVNLNCKRGLVVQGIEIRPK